MDIRHVYIRPRTPHLNGKVERSHRVADQEFYRLLDKTGITDDIHLFNDKRREWNVIASLECFLHIVGATVGARRIVIPMSSSTSRRRSAEQRA